MNRYFKSFFLLIGAFSVLPGCISYGPALLGNEYPFVPLADLDTVPTVSTGAYGTLGWPQTYEPNDGNRLAGAGVYQSRSRAVRRPHQDPNRRSPGWSFVYGGMGYAGRYRVGRDSVSYQYQGGMVHGAARLHLSINKRATFVLEPALSVFYETGDYLRFREAARADTLSLLRSVDTAQPLSATLLFSQIINYQINNHWTIAGAYTTGLPLNQFLTRYQFSGTLAVTRDQFTLWARPGMHLSTFSPIALIDYTLATGLGYRIARR